MYPIIDWMKIKFEDGRRNLLSRPGLESSEEKNEGKKKEKDFLVPISRVAYKYYNEMIIFYYIFL